MKSTALSLLLLPVVAQASFLGDLATNANRVASSPCATGGDLVLKLGEAEYVHVFTNTTAAAAFTQWMVPLGFLASNPLPLRVSGS